MAPSNTFFEQIPIEIVKRIATEFPEERPIGSNCDKTEMPDDKSDWRELAVKVQHERDPKRMTELVEQLISSLDAQKKRNHPPLKRDAGNRSLTRG